MKKEYAIQLAIGGGLLLIAVILVPLLRSGGQFDPWIPVICGAIAIPLIFPALARWARDTKEKHKALSTGLVVLLVCLLVGWSAFMVLTIIGIFK